VTVFIEGTAAGHQDGPGWRDVFCIESKCMSKINVFVASPGDVDLERDAVAKVVNEVNFALAIIAPEKDTSLELKQWKTHVHPEMGRPQGVINKQIGSYDIFIGLMWKRFGTATGVANSGTEEEFRHAYEEWQKTGRPRILFYFCQEPYTVGSSDDVEQLAKVIAFRTELAPKGLVWEYSRHSEFGDIVRTHILQVVGELMSEGRTAVEVATTVGREALASGVPVVRTELTELAREYEELRRILPSGDERTRKMESVMTQMRTQAQYAYPLLSELTASDSQGERLIAVAILETLPTPEYLDWLAERLDPKKEKAFLGYHAALALLYAVRKSNSKSCHLLKRALRRAAYLAKDLPENTDRRFALASAVGEYDTKCCGAN
jgi:hypothetical protein